MVDEKAVRALKLYMSVCTLGVVVTLVGGVIHSVQEMRTRAELNRSQPLVLPASPAGH